VGHKKSSQWVEYEKLARQIVIDLMPYAEVKWNDNIVGNRSAAYRQIDVTARWRANDEDLLMVVSVKDWKTRASIKAVDSFIGELEDVGVSRAILVCSGGFSKQAVRYARRYGIALMSLQNARSIRWSKRAKDPNSVGAADGRSSLQFRILRGTHRIRRASERSSPSRNVSGRSK